MRHLLCSLAIIVGLASCGGGSGGTSDPGTGTDQGTGPVGDVYPDVAVDPGTVDPGTTPPDTGTDPGTADPGCAKKCDGKTCGPDGCGGTCGTCSGDKPYCNEGVCQADCVMPKKWGPSAVVLGMQIPDKAEDIAKLCEDFWGGGAGQNALKAVASIANPEFVKAFDGASYVLLMEFLGVTDFVKTAAFPLNGLAAIPDPAGGKQDFLLVAGSYDEKTCTPTIHFPDSLINDSWLEAGPADFSLAFPVSDIPMAFTVKTTRVQAKVSADATGVTMEDGILTGVLTKAEVDKAMDVAQQYCDKAVTKPTWCGSLGLAIAALPLIYDLKTREDGGYDECDKACSDAGKGDAASVCLLFTAGPATIKDYRPPAE
jgi:hypothetical protein